MSTISFRDSVAGKFVRGVVIMISAVFMILPAYINYQLGPTKLGFNALVSIAISLQLFAIGVILFILAVGKERFMPKPQPQ